VIIPRTSSETAVSVEMCFRRLTRASSRLPANKENEMTDETQSTALLSALSQEELSRSLFYPACGFDLQPLVRFSHLTDTFVYADWFFSRERVISDIRRELGRITPLLRPGSLELVGLESDVRLGARERRMLTSMSPDLPLTSQEASCHRMRMREVASGRDPWAMLLKFRRTVAGRERFFKLLYIGGEALTAYSLLYRFGAIAPRFLVTIQSGLAFGGGYAHVEDPHPGGIMDRFLSRWPAKPLVWLRGRWAGNRGSTALEPGWPYQHLVQGYSGWLAGMFAEVAAFSEAPLARFVKSAAVIRAEGTGRTVRVAQQVLSGSELDDYDLVVAPPRLATRLEQGRVLASPGGSCPLERCLAWLDRECARRNVRRCLFVGQGLEDEGVALEAWAHGTGRCRELDVRVRHELDFADLRLDGRALAIGVEEDSPGRAG